MVIIPLGKNLNLNLNLEMKQRKKEEQKMLKEQVAGEEGFLATLNRESLWAN